MRLRWPHTNSIIYEMHIEQNISENEKEDRLIVTIIIITNEKLYWAATENFISTTLILKMAQKI